MMTGEHSRKGRNEFCVLVLDENPATAERVREALKEMGRTHPVHWCDALDEAFDMLASLRIAVVIAQLRLDGDEISGALKTLKRHHPETLVVVLTSAREAAIVTDLIAHGDAHSCLHNPINRTRLGRALAGAIDAHGDTHLARSAPLVTTKDSGNVSALRTFIDHWRSRPVPLES